MQQILGSTHIAIDRTGREKKEYLGLRSTGYLGTNHFSVELTFLNARFGGFDHDINGLPGDLPGFFQHTYFFRALDKPHFFHQGCGIGENRIGHQFQNANIVSVGHRMRREHRAVSHDPDPTTLILHL